MSEKPNHRVKLFQAKANDLGLFLVPPKATYFHLSV